MTKSAVHTTNAPQPAGPYSQGVEVNGLFYTAGFGPQDPATGAVAATAGAQTSQTLRNIKRSCQNEGSPWTTASRPPCI